MTGEWKPAQTGTHQDHVIAHVIGATVLGYFEADDALHLALDINFIWTIFPDAEMGLLPQSLALRELNIGEAERARLLEDLRRLDEEGAEAESLACITPAPEGCLIGEVRLLERDEMRRLEILGEAAALVVETSTRTGEMSVGLLQG
ncbi:MAG TPA: hypothetical protein VEY11_08255 [Pyrinomonadaceae bacterium]|nr:hypothetical protein [Pyrinomonadaceae bacterium]